MTSGEIWLILGETVRYDFTGPLSSDVAAGRFGSHAGLNIENGGRGLAGLSQAIAGTAREIAESLPEDNWQSLSAGDGTKGQRLYGWAYLVLADLDAGDHGRQEY